MLYKLTKPDKTIRFAIAILTFILVITSFSVFSQTDTYAASKGITLKVNGEVLNMDVPAQIIDSRTMIPARALFEKIGGEVSWNTDDSVVTINYNNQIIKLTINSKTALVNGASKALDVPAQIVNGRTLIPVRFVSESLNFKVEWDEKTQTVSITVGNTAASSGLGTITGIKITHGDESNMYTQAVITSSTALSDSDYKKFSLSGPDRYVIDFYKHTAAKTLSGTLYSCSSSYSMVSGVRAANHDDNTYRIVFDLNSASAPKITLSSDRKTMTVYFNCKSKADSSGTTSGSSSGTSSSSGSSSGSGTAASASSFDPYEDGKLIVMLDPGHGKSTGGKRSPDSTLMEYEFNRAVAKYLKSYLESYGVTVLMTVSDNTDLSLSERSAKANESDADIFVSIHANAFGDGITWENDATGWEIYYYSTSSVGKKLAEYIHDANKNDIGIKDRGVKTANFAVIKNTVIPAVLIEHGFYTSETEVELLKSDTWRKKAAELDAKGIMAFFNSYKK